MTSVLHRIQAYNEGRQPDILRRKYKGMREDPFRFFRGSCHLFYEDLHGEAVFREAPAAWICGDLHLENFGSYKGDNELTYFDINDFDEAVQAPFTWDVGRLLTSILVGCIAMKADEEHARDYCRICLDAYCRTMAKGKARHIEAATARGRIRDLIEEGKDRDHEDLLKKRTRDDGKKLELDEKQLELDHQLKKQLIRKVEDWIAEKNDERFNDRILDAAFRIAGTGGLGRKRYILLTEHDSRHPMLIDIKESTPPSALPWISTPNPAWDHEAQRIIWTQEMMQYEPPALLSPFPFEGSWYVLKALQPSADTINYKCLRTEPHRMHHLFEDLGMLTAAAHLRTTGHRQAATADELMQAAAGEDWKKEIIGIAHDYCSRTVGYYREFCMDCRD